MSHAELDRFGIITRVLERRLTQIEAARVLGLCVRQVQRLCAAVSEDGADGPGIPQAWSAQQPAIPGEPSADDRHLDHGQLFGFRADVSVREASRAARHHGVQRDGPQAHDQGWDLADPGSTKTQDPAAAVTPAVLRRADPDRRLGSPVV